MKGVTLIIAIWIHGDLKIDRYRMDDMPECLKLAKTTSAISPLLKVFCSEMPGDLPSWRETYRQQKKIYRERRGYGK